MAKEGRGTILSLRISEDEQLSLRQYAEAHGTSVSDLVRSLVHREVTPQVRSTASVTTTTVSIAHSIGQGIFWDVSLKNTDSGGTVTICGY